MYARKTILCSYMYLVDFNSNGMTQTAYGKVVCYIVQENVAYIYYLNNARQLAEMSANIYLSLKIQF